MKKRTFLSKLHRNGLYCFIGALILLLGVPLYQLLLLMPSGYSNALATQSLALRWINAHSLLFLGYRALLIAGFAFIISLPFSLFRSYRPPTHCGRDPGKFALSSQQRSYHNLSNTHLEQCRSPHWRPCHHHLHYRRRTASTILLVLWCSYRKKWTKSLARGMGRVLLPGSSPRRALQRKRCRSCLCPHRWPGATNYPCNPPLCCLGPLVRCDARSPKTRVRAV